MKNMQLKIKHNLTLKQISRMVVAVFFILTIFFLSFPPAYNSFYRQTLILFNLQISFIIYDYISTAVGMISFGIALLLIIFFHKTGKDLQKTASFVSIDLALKGFIIQASIALSLHRYRLITSPPVTHGIGWLVFDMTVWTLLGATVIIFFASLILAIHHKVSRSFGLIVSVLLLIGHILNLIFGAWVFQSSKYTTLILATTSIMSIYYLWKAR